ncbi:VOC family protein [Nocardia pneumoniae]|uniref:VOC family protein n=1 Tax=Nocardia pneumoniae TaxID=228601 RepID=UPI0005924DFD|nr:VOC family protein [Nocardia pneumoniae]
MSNGKDLALSHVGVLVADQQKALEFYRDVIGLEVRADLPFAGGRWVTVGPAQQPGIEFILETPEMVPDDAARTAAQSRLASGAQGTLIFVTDAVDATFARLRDAGVEVTQEPISQPYGVRDCGFRDPWGNHLRFSELPG